MRQQESFLTAQQAEGYTAMINHELEAPIDTIIFLMTLIMKLLSKIAGQDPRLKQIKNYCITVKAQLVFIQTFVDDLLALKQIQQNRLTAEMTAFNPNKIFKLLGAIFAE